MEAPPVTTTASLGPRTSLTHDEGIKTYADIPLHRQCGVLRSRRYPDGRTVLYRVRCRRRRCELCKPRVIADKMTAIPVDVTLYTTVVRDTHWQSFARQLRRKGADYVRIPIGYNESRVVSTRMIGAEITWAQTEQFMLAARPEWGRIGRSKDWQSPVSVVRQGDDGVDEGIVTRDTLDVLAKATERFGAPRRTATSATWRLSDPDHAWLRAYAGVVPDSLYWTEHLRDLAEFHQWWHRQDESPHRWVDPRFEVAA